MGLVALSLTPAAFGEIKAKLEALGLKESRVKDLDGLEALVLDDFLITKDKGVDDVAVYIAYNGKILREPKE